MRLKTKLLLVVDGQLRVPLKHINLVQIGRQVRHADLLARCVCHSRARAHLLAALEVDLVDHVEQHFERRLEPLLSAAADRGLQRQRESPLFAPEPVVNSRFDSAFIAIDGQYLPREGTGHRVRCRQISNLRVLQALFTRLSHCDFSLDGGAHSGTVLTVLREGIFAQSSYAKPWRTQSSERFDLSCSLGRSLEHSSRDFP
jgi:hypothetical protein